MYLQISITYALEQKPLGIGETIYSSCAVLILFRMQNTELGINNIISTKAGCPNLVRTSAAEISKGYICSSDKKKVTVNGKEYCCESKLFVFNYLIIKLVILPV